MEPAGVIPPTTTVSLSGSGNGAIVGTYTAYLRFVDKYGNVSDLSPVSGEFTASGSSGTVTGATNATPIVVTSANHGLATGDVVKIEGVGGNTSANDTWPVTVIGADSFSLDDSTGTATYTGGGTWLSGIDTVTYSSVQVTADPKVARRQLLRSTDGQADVYYVDVDTEDLSSTTFDSTLTDQDLLASEAVPLFDADGFPLANRFGIPPNHKSVLAHHKDRMFAAVERSETGGSCQVAQSSLTVTGIGTRWKAALAERSLYVRGATQPYEIAAVDEAAQTLTLTEPYLDPTDLFALYAVRAAPAAEKIVAYSESNLPEAWPAINGIALQEDNDFLTGLMPKGPWLYVLENKHIYRLTFLADPAADGAVFLAADRGCVNNRCWVTNDEAAYLLDEEGVYAFSGSQEVKPASAPICNLFSTTPGSDRWRINWTAREHFHAVLFQPDQVMRWFVSLSGSWLPRHALCYNYRDERWWIEEYPFPIASSCVGRVRGRPTLLLGASARRVLAYGAGHLDGPDPTAGTVRGTVTGSGRTWLTDATAGFATGLAGLPVALVYGRGKGQVRIVTAVSGATLKVDRPWRIQPDTTTRYQLGGVPWRWKSTWFRFVQAESQSARRLETVFQPLKHPTTLDMRLRLDFAAAPKNFETAMSSAQANGVESTKDSPDLVCDLTKPTGIVHARFPGSKEYYTDGGRFVQVELRGFGGREPVAVYQVTLDGVAEGG